MVEFLRRAEAGVDKRFAQIELAAVIKVLGEFLEQLQTALQNVATAESVAVAPGSAMCIGPPPRGETVVRTPPVGRR